MKYQAMELSAAFGFPTVDGMHLLTAFYDMIIDRMLTNRARIQVADHGFFEVKFSADSKGYTPRIVFTPTAETKRLVKEYWNKNNLPKTPNELLKAEREWVMKYGNKAGIGDLKTIFSNRTITIKTWIKRPLTVDIESVRKIMGTPLEMFYRKGEGIGIYKKGSDTPEETGQTAWEAIEKYVYNQILEKQWTPKSTNTKQI
jgi:hypothetical protein